MRKLAHGLAAGALLLCATNATAQTTVPATASITIPTLLSISVDVVTVGFPQPTFADFDGGSIQSAATSVVSTRGNVLHDVTIAANAASMTYTGTETPGPKPASDLKWSNDAGATWTGLSTTAADVATALSRGVNAAAASVGYRMLLDVATDLPGTYDLAFTYTVVAN